MKGGEGLQVDEPGPPGLGSQSPPCWLWGVWFPDSMVLGHLAGCVPG